MRKAEPFHISLSPGMQTGVTKTRKVLRVEPAMRRGAKLSGACARCGFSASTPRIVSGGRATNSCSRIREERPSNGARA
jgi:hypothetical protein